MSRLTTVVFADVFLLPAQQQYTRRFFCLDLISIAESNSCENNERSGENPLIKSACRGDAESNCSITVKS